MKEKRDVAIRKGSAERAMLDEIIALPDIEEQEGENVAMWVANALEALREERDAAIRERDLRSNALEALREERDAAIRERDLRSRVIEEIKRRIKIIAGSHGVWTAAPARALKREVERHQPAVFVPIECGWCDCLWPCPTITDTAEELGVKEQA